MEKYVEDLDAVRAALGVDAIDLFGHSWGGLVAQRYAERYGDKVRYQCVFSSTFSSFCSIFSQGKFLNPIKEFDNFMAAKLVLKIETMS